MDHLTSPEFVRRLQLLREKLAPLMGRLEFFSAAPRGRLTTPEIDSHRPYAQGEDLRYIDWNLYARLDRFFIKTVVAEEEGLLHLLVDTSTSMRNPHPEKQPRSLEIAAGIAYLILSAGNQLAVHSWADRLLLTRQYNRGESETHDLLHQLSTLPVGGETDLGATLANLRRISRGHIFRTIIISDLLEINGYFQQLEFLQAQGARVGIIQTLNPLEISPRLRGHLALVDPETGNRKTRVVGYRTLRTYRKAVADFHRETEEAFSRMDIPFLRASSLTGFEDSVIRFMTLPGWRGGR
ncbi:MAG: DUF58 domain-containing protein [bacterium]|nr:DUF58 domain-containing protein [bacterium]MDT8366907.1 DUF58 domain-containing protein [bacterium]